MWLKLANATFSVNLGQMSVLSNSISIKYNGLNGAFAINKSSVSKDDTSAELKLTLNSGWTCTSASATVTGASETSDSYSNGVLTINIKPSSGTTFGESDVTEIVINVTHDATEESEPETPVNPTNYTFTINPTPTSATVTLSATGYSTVSGTGSKSITVANGTTVNWRVSADGYTTRTGSWTINGGNKTENITLTATSGGEDEGETSVVFDFDFTKSTLADYADDGIFTVPDTSTIDAIAYDTTKGANLNNNLPYGLTLTNPIDASRPWTLEFTATMVTPTALVGNRRAFMTGGSDLAPFVVISFSGTDVASQGFQISNGSHKWVGTGKLTCDQEVSYKIVHDGASNIVVYQNGAEFGTTTCDFTGKTFGTILGVIKGKSSAYIWQDVESGKKSYLKKFKFSYN